VDATAKVSSKGQVTVPKAVRDALGVVEGDEIAFRVEGNRALLARTPDFLTPVEVRFVAETPRRTRVELEHRNIDRHGPGWQSVSEGVADDAGWPLYLARYAALFSGRSSMPPTTAAGYCERPATSACSSSDTGG